MRIIAGKLKHRIIPAPPGVQTRPTSDRARETLFDVLGQHVVYEQVHVLDLYAGSGALAFEALSRGAAGATLVDASIHVCKHLRATSIELGVSDNVTIVRADALSYLYHGNPDITDVVFADPPYGLKSCNSILGCLARGNALRVDGVVALEHSDQEHILPLSEMLPLKSIEIGITLIDVYRRLPAEP
ncbi:MAG: hypothetical protein RLZZ273_973 [Bacteroidota bacterium]|jgi:16S rRNA (guanine966-N2)-methyltransferase